MGKYDYLNAQPMPEEGVEPDGISQPLEHSGESGVGKYAYLDAQPIVEEEEREKYSTLDSGTRGAVQGVTLGQADEIYSGIGGAYNAMTTDETYSDSYDRLVNEQRMKNQDAERDNPLTYMAGDLVGGAVIPMGLAGSAVKATKYGAKAYKAIDKASDVVAKTGAVKALAKGKGKLDDLVGKASDKITKKYGDLPVVRNLPRSKNPKLTKAEDANAATHKAYGDKVKDYKGKKAKADEDTLQAGTKYNAANTKGKAASKAEQAKVKQAKSDLASEKRTIAGEKRAESARVKAANKESAAAHKAETAKVKAANSAAANKVKTSNARLAEAAAAKNAKNAAKVATVKAENAAITATNKKAASKVAEANKKNKASAVSKNAKQREKIEAVKAENRTAKANHLAEKAKIEKSNAREKLRVKTSTAKNPKPAKLKDVPAAPKLKKVPAFKASPVKVSKAAKVNKLKKVPEPKKVVAKKADAPTPQTVKPKSEAQTAKASREADRSKVDAAEADSLSVSSKQPDATEFLEAKQRGAAIQKPDRTAVEDSLEKLRVSRRDYPPVIDSLPQTTGEAIGATIGGLGGSAAGGGLGGGVIGGAAGAAGGVKAVRAANSVAKAVASNPVAKTGARLGALAATGQGVQELVDGGETADYTKAKEFAKSDNDPEYKMKQKLAKLKAKTDGQ